MNNRQQLPDTVDIVVIAARKDELSFLLNEKEYIDWSESIMSKDFPCQIGTFLSRSYPAQPLKIAAACAREMGLVDAGILATTAILCWQQKPKLLVMIGICGGRKKSTIDYGDIIVPKLTYLYQFGSYENGKLKPRLMLAEVSIRAGLIQYMEDILNSDKLGQICTDAFDRGLPLPPERIHKRKDERLKAHFEPMGSADLVVKDDEKLEEAILADEKVVAVEMEAYAVLRTAKLFDIDAIVIKSVSDFCGGKDDTYREYAKFTATEAFYLLVNYLAQKDYFGPYEKENPPVLKRSAKGVDYTQLEKLLKEGKWKEADQETADRMLEVANRRRGSGLDVEHIDNFPCEDLRIIDQLWVHYSNGRFGFSVQKDIYLRNDGIWQKFRDEVGWGRGGECLNYSDLTFELRNTTPEGHLPVLRSWRNGVKMSIGIKGSSLASLAYRLVDCSTVQCT